MPSDSGHCVFSNVYKVHKCIQSHTCTLRNNRKIRILVQIVYVSEFSTCIVNGYHRHQVHLRHDVELVMYKYI